VETRDGLLFFTEKTNEYAEAIMREYFNGMEIVGWMQSQPSYGVYLNQQYGAYHRHVFPRDHQVMFVMDPLEDTNSFYSWSPEREAMHEIRGYFIYYDKNKNMHEYMLHDRATDHVPPPSAYVEVFGRRDDREEERPATDAGTRTEELIKKRAEDRSRSKRSSLAQKRSMNLMAGLSAALFIICFVMGAGLIQNRDRISEMQVQISQLSTAYRNLFVQLSGEGTSPAFAAQLEGQGGQGVLPDTSTPRPATEVPLPQEAAGPQAPLMTDLPFATEPPVTVTPEQDALATPVAAPTEAPAAPVPTEPVAVEPGEGIPAEVVVTEPVDAAVPEAYTIQPGDSLLNISLEFYGTTGMVDEILALNGITNADKIVAGKTIALPRP
jgi:LysM repeat protein